MFKNVKIEWLNDKDRNIIVLGCYGGIHTENGGKT